MTFKPPYQVHMVFNTPSLQMAYHLQYQQLIEFKLCPLCTAAAAAGDPLPESLLEECLQKPG
ncbi:hypothetical protein CIHG_10547 [Coccidioides immitis H538.4]|uniref:Uncharacterized protein n=1 Tax=Coccidioides immitis H538.4 TaxID=396776 RepID=A0A0J8S767_COCIT|nr:hypothetical protein CIHG_10547 [Coccidioides immitis H538.4]